jgi:putative mRNA 3-end processing factor
MLLELTANGLYCSQGDFYIDPWKPVERALITHAHSDHARWGSKEYLCHDQTLPLLRLRLGDQSYSSLPWGTSIQHNGVSISFHPAGHIIGSAQIRLEHKGEIWVVSGDYKTIDDGLSGVFEPVPCHTFISESTFGLPIYRWQPQEKVYEQMRQWILGNEQTGRSSVLLAYSLGKAQRVLKAIGEMGRRILVHGAIWNTHETLRSMGIVLPDVERITPETPKEWLKKSIIVAPPSVDGSTWLKKFTPYAVGICSGWMQVRGHVRRRNADAGFVLSDHADWPGLLEAVEATRAGRVLVTHGFQSVFARYLSEKGLEASALQTAFGGEEEGGDGHE